jgi:hypothetical protein
MQFGNLLYIPKSPAKLFVLSDVEGDIGALVALMRRENLLTRMAKGQAQLVIMGDIIDRQGGLGSLCFDLLLDLKFRRGFRDTIHILAGNHELSPAIQQFGEHGGFFDEVVRRRRSYANLGDLGSPLATMILDWHASKFEEEQVDSAPPLRVALWRLYNEVFTQLPKVVLTGNGAVLCHAGLTDKGPFGYVRDPAACPSPPSFAEAIRWLAGLEFVQEDIENLEELQNLSVYDYTWSDLTDDRIRTAPNTCRRCGLLIGPDALQSMLDVVGGQVMIRGHQKTPPDGAELFSAHVWTLGERAITINSVLPDGPFINTECGLAQDFSRQYLEAPLDQQLRSADDIAWRVL